jgi:tRNA(Ile)-lysidine synthase
MAGAHRRLEVAATVQDRPLGGPGWSVVDLARKTIERFGMLEGGEGVVVGVSGGPDSTCLLDVLTRLRGKLGLNLVVAHVDHGLSEDSQVVAARVANSGAAAGFEVHLARAPELAGANLHARARDFRYEFFDIVAEREGAQRIATGHTLDDRVETTLARLIHGAGTSGLAGLPPVEGRRIRPLVELRRAESRAYCEECGLEFYEDPANEDPRFERASVRSEVVAAIERRWGEGAIRAMAKSSERLLEDARALDAIAGRLFKEVVTTEGDERKISLEALVSMPRAYRRRVLELAVGRVRDRSGGIDAVLDALDRPAGAAKEARFAVASGTEIVLTADAVTVVKLDR